MSVSQAEQIYSHIEAYRPRNVLELGFAHGVSTCYFAGALEEIGGGRVVTVDREWALARDPNIHQLLSDCGLADGVDVMVTPTSYTWVLMHFLEQYSEPVFDFAYIDGAHLWDVDGFAFFLVDRLLKPGSWVLFDDLDWTLDTSPSLKDVDWVRALPPEQRTTPQVGKVFELLVRTHDRYGDFQVDGSWGWARKLA